MRCILCAYPLNDDRGVVDLIPFGIAHSWCADEKHLESIIHAVDVNLSLKDKWQQDEAFREQELNRLMDRIKTEYGWF
jgi:hypothetical protein